MAFYFIKKEEKKGKDRGELGVLALINNLTNSNWAPLHYQHHPLSTQGKSQNPICRFRISDPDFLLPTKV